MRLEDSPKIRKLLVEEQREGWRTASPSFRAGLPNELPINGKRPDIKFQVAHFGINDETNIGDSPRNRFIYDFSHDVSTELRRIGATAVRLSRKGPNFLNIEPPEAMQHVERMWDYRQESHDNELTYNQFYHAVVMAANDNELLVNPGNYKFDVDVDTLS